MTGTEATPRCEDAAPDHQARITDQKRVAQAREGHRHARLVWLLIGPGLLAMLGENDGPSMLSYAADGAAYGLGFFVPFIPSLFLVAYVCQEMAMRVGAVTGRGFGELVLLRYGRAWGWFAAADLVATNLVTLVAEFVVIRIGLAYFGLGAPIAVALGITLTVLSLGAAKYRRWERIVLGLAVFNILFLVAAVLVKPNPSDLVAALRFQPLPTGTPTTILLLITSTIGATVTPWMIFFQQSTTVDKGLTSADIRHGRLDTGLGAALAATFGVAALILGVAAVASHSGAVTSLAAADFPSLLDRAAGPAVGSLFALGLIQSGALAILTISASTGYAAAECLGAPRSMNSTPRRASVFYTTTLVSAATAGLIVLLPGAPLLAIALNANVLATVLLPVSLVFLLMLSSDKELMGLHANGRSTNALAIISIALVGSCGAAYGTASFLEAVHVLPS
ncbi:NRAMP family divalent metal transporter [Amnibacterium sp.]|uniref:NRAMP family divalent metal transporter n=1 Tax=Amnibacterium sp. TaxID=1872496 RepID=UPI003F7CBCFB